MLSLQEEALGLMNHNTPSVYMRGLVHPSTPPGQNSARSHTKSATVAKKGPSSYVWSRLNRKLQAGWTRPCVRVGPPCTDPEHLGRETQWAEDILPFSQLSDSASHLRKVFRCWMRGGERLCLKSQEGMRVHLRSTPGFPIGEHCCTTAQNSQICWA